MKRVEGKTTAGIAGNKYWAVTVRCPLCSQRPVFAVERVNELGEISTNNDFLRAVPVCEHFRKSEFKEIDPITGKKKFIFFFDK